MEKVCSRCFSLKTLSLYPKSKTCKDGHRSYCKVCDKVRKDFWREKNKEHHNAKGRQWAADNREKRLAIQKKWRQEAAISGKSKEIQRKWREANKEKARAYVNARRTKVKQATPQWVNVAEITKVYEEAQKLGLTVDHIVPIRHKLVCGLHVPWNLQLMEASKNYAKSNLFEGTRSR
jgi:hypothetical protein